MDTLKTSETMDQTAVISPTKATDTFETLTDSVITSSSVADPNTTLQVKCFWFLSAQ